MTNKVAVFNYENNQVRSVAVNGDPWFVLADLCKVLELSNPTMVAKKLDLDERAKSDLGLQERNVTLVNESGMYAVILRSDKPQAKPFRKWVTSEVLPAIRKTGKYAMGGGITGEKEELRKKNTEIRAQNARIRTAQLLWKVSEKTDTDYKQVLHARITHLLTGEYLLPLPAVNERTYTAGEIGEKLGVSSNKIGRLANLHGLKTEKYGKYFYDKAKTAEKQVETFRYYECAIEVFRALLDAEVAA